MATTVEFTDHLKAIGAFKAFQERKQTYEADGLYKKEAWEKAARDFGWKPHWSPPDSEEDERPELPELPTRGDWDLEISPKEAERMLESEECLKRQVPYVEAVDWVSKNLRNRRATPMTAPDAAAWSILMWAKSNRNRFFSDVLPKALTSNAESKPPVLEDDGRTEFNVLKHFTVECPHCGGVIA